VPLLAMLASSALLPAPHIIDTAIAFNSRHSNHNAPAVSHRTVQVGWDIDGVVFFAAADRLVDQMQHRGLTCITYDRLEGGTLDMASSFGFVHAVRLAMRLKPRGICWLAVPGSSWMFRDRSKSGRTKQHPEGDPSVPDVAHDNLVLARLCLISAICIAKGCIVVMEQPSTSIAHLESATYSM
jgi:hypothetical protein